MKKLYYYETVIGKIGIAEEYGFVTNICFRNMKQPLDSKLYETDLLKETFVQLTEYLDGKRKEFDIPLNPSGTDFQQKVWCEVLNIAYGEKISYKDLAERMKNKNSAIAVGNALNKNPIPIIIPCHRVVSSDNKLEGYNGGIEIKKFLLNLEYENSIQFCK